MQMYRDLSSHPVHVVAALHAQQPCHGRQRARRNDATVVLVGGNVAVLAKRTAHVAGGKKDRAGAARSAVYELFPEMMEIRRHARLGAELAGAEVRFLCTVHPA